MFRRWSLRRWSSKASASKRALLLDSVFIDMSNDVLSPVAASPTATTPPSKKENNKSPYDFEEYAAAGGSGFSIQLTVKFIVATIFLTASIAFTVGCIARNILLAPSPSTMLSSNYQDAIAVALYPVDTTIMEQLPTPTILDGKEVPPTLYTSKNFDERGHTVHLEHTTTSSEDDEICSSKEEEENQLSNTSGYDDSVVEEDVEYSHDGLLYVPAGQHLLIDIKDVDASFLNSEVDLANAMVELINETKLTMLSYHCHSLVPIGVSCVGVLLESHIAFHTWPLAGAITMDLFTCGSSPLVPILPLIQSLFGIPSSSSLDAIEPTMNWSHKKRGFGEDFATPDRKPAYNDLDVFLGIHSMDVKEKVASESTAFQNFDVYDVMGDIFKDRDTRSYHKSLSNDDSYEAKHPEFFAPDRVLFLDGVIQSTLRGDASYHESIVHPALIAHDDPKRVAIIGGGEGATLREVLKHSTVEEAVMIEIDEGVVELSKEYLPQWQDCSSIAHHDQAAAWCFDDTRVTPKFEDAMAYFIDGYHTNDEEEDKFSVIIMDALDPNDEIPFAVELYTSEVYIQSLYNALDENGILVVQVGEAPTEHSPADETGHFANRAIMKNKLEEVGFKSIHVYEEGHSKFLMAWTTLVAFKDVETKKNWYRSAAEVELQLQKRILSRPSGESSLRYFDGATMLGYQLPSKGFEAVHCRQENVPEDCGRDFNENMDIISDSSNTTVYNPILERHNSGSRSPGFSLRV